MNAAPSRDAPDMMGVHEQDAEAGDHRQGFWTENQPGFRFTGHPTGSPEFFAEIERHRYALEPAIPEIVDFSRWRERDVLEAGCGIATDGINFARAGANYVGVDFSPAALELAQRRFEIEGRSGRFVAGSVTDLPMPDASFDLVYSCGVIHHVPDTQQAIREFHRVLRPGGVALVMVYHRDSLNCRVSIMLLRRALVGTLLLPGMTRVVSRITGEDVNLLRSHRDLLREHGMRYLTDRQLFLSNNTDGPGNPLSKVYSRADAKRSFSGFAEVRTSTRFLNLRTYPCGERLAATGPARRLERRIGWHLWIQARKAASG